VNLLSTTDKTTMWKEIIITWIGPITWEILRLLTLRVHIWHNWPSQSWNDLVDIASVFEKRLQNSKSAAIQHAAFVVSVKYLSMAEMNHHWVTCWKIFICFPSQICMQQATQCWCPFDPGFFHTLLFWLLTNYLLLEVEVIFSVSS